MAAGVTGVVGVGIIQADPWVIERVKPNRKEQTRTISEIKTTTDPHSCDAAWKGMVARLAPGEQVRLSTQGELLRVQSYGKKPRRMQKVVVR